MDGHISTSDGYNLGARAQFRGSRCLCARVSVIHPRGGLGARFARHSKTAPVVVTHVRAVVLCLRENTSRAHGKTRTTSGLWSVTIFGPYSRKLIFPPYDLSPARLVSSSFLYNSWACRAGASLFFHAPTGRFLILAR